MAKNIFGDAWPNVAKLHYGRLQYVQPFKHKEGSLLWTKTEPL